MSEPEVVRRETFGWRETGARLRALAASAPLAPDERGRWLAGPGVRFTPPAVLPLGAATTAQEYLAGLPDELGLECVVLLQAGAAALGLWRADVLLQHKALKKYVVRGRGRAQPTHLKSRGKSRYGSRLRLQNARSLLSDVNARLVDWAASEGDFERVHCACPVRLWAELLRARPAPPFAPSGEAAAPARIRRHVDVPCFDELLRVRRALVRGRVEWLAGDVESA